MDSYQQNKHQVLSLIESCKMFAEAHEQPETAKRLGEAEQHLADGKLLVVVCGELKQGKSSLINALLEEPDLLPVDVDVATNLVCTLAYSVQENITVIIGREGAGSAQTISRSEIPDYVTEQRNRGNQRDAQMLIIETPNDKLKEGLVLADTPGIGSLNVQHTDITYGYIPKSDVTIFVSDAAAPLSSEELKFITGMIAPHCDNVIYVVTKTDNFPDYRAVVASNLLKLSQVLGRPTAEITICPISSRNKLDYLVSGDREDLQDSNFEIFEQALWDILSVRRGSILLARALSELGRSLAEMKGPLLIEWEACQQHNQNELDRLEGELRQARERHQALLENDAIWRTQLNRGLNVLQSELLESFGAGFRRIRANAERYLDDVVLVQSPEQIAGSLEVEIDALLTTITRDLSQSAAELQGRIETATGLDLNPFDAAPLALRTANVPARQIQLEKTGWWPKALEVTTKATFDGGAGVTIGSIVGGVVGGVVGALFGGVGAIPGVYIGSALGGLVGGLGGISSGVRHGLRQIDETDHHLAREKVKEQIEPYLEDTQAFCLKELNQMTRKLDVHMQEELMNQIRRAMKTAKRTLHSVKAARKLTAEQAAQRAHHLQEQLHHLGELQAAMDQTANVVMGPGPATGIPHTRSAGSSGQNNSGTSSGDHGGAQTQ
jgi:predicted GTPase